MAEATWGESLGLRPPNPKTYSRAVPLAARCPSLLYGIELEIEGVHDPLNIKTHGFAMKDDGSLRNNGKEFVSSPMSYSHLHYSLKNFFESNKFTADNYSERCSIHVHTNCHNLTTSQIASICLIYQVYEDLLFAWVGANRSENIFCVPWNQTNLSWRLFDSDDPAHAIKRMKNWQKYTALNLLPLYTQSTIEWRHMEGHAEVERIFTWLQLIGSIYQYALDNKKADIESTLVSLNTTSAYDNLTHQIFGPYAGFLLSKPGANIMLEEGVLNMKVSLMGKNYKVGVAKPSVIFDDLIDALAQPRERVLEVPPGEIIGARNQAADLVAWPADVRRAGDIQRQINEVRARMDAAEVRRNPR